jgi:hypothetical protein
MNSINSIPGLREPYPPAEEPAIAEATAVPAGASEAPDAAIASPEPLQSSSQAALEQSVWEGRTPGQRLFVAPAPGANGAPETATSADLDRYAEAVLAPIFAQ